MSARGSNGWLERCAVALVAITVTACGPPPPSSRTQRPTAESREPRCVPCAQQFAAKVVELHAAGWRLAYISVIDTRSRWRYGLIVMKTIWVQDKRALGVTLAFGAGGTYPSRYSVESVAAPREDRVYVTQEPLVAALRRAAPKGIDRYNGSGWSLAIEGADGEVYVDVDPDSYYTVVSRASGADGPTALRAALAASSKKGRLAEASVDGSGRRLRMLWVGRQDRVIVATLNEQGRPIDLEVRAAQNLVAERLATSALERSLRAWLASTAQVAQVLSASASAIVLVNQAGARLTIDRAAFESLERTERDDDDSEPTPSPDPGD